MLRQQKPAANQDDDVMFYTFIVAWTMRLITNLSMRSMSMDLLRHRCRLDHVQYGDSLLKEAIETNSFDPEGKRKKGCGSW